MKTVSCALTDGFRYQNSPCDQPKLKDRPLTSKDVINQSI